MEAEDALKDLLLEIAHQETNISASPTKQRTSWIGRARTSSRPVSARPEKEQQDDVEDTEDNVAGADTKDEDGIEDDSESFIHSGFGSRKITMEGGVRLSTAFQRDWWRSLPDLSYVVTKINQYGKRQTRTLRLTAEGIENVRKSSKVSSLYPYEAVLRVYMKNVKTFIIDYENAKHSYQYRSTVAMHIVQEITSRLALRKKEERLLTPDIATRLQEKLQQTGLLDSSRESRRRLPTIIENEEDRQSRQAKKLHNIFGSTEQQRLENAIDYIILDDHTPEGRTLKHFCSNFAVLEKNPATLVMNVRQFMDDMRAYILERRATELTKLTGKTSVDPLEELSLSTVVEKSLERALVSRFRDRIVACLKKPTKEEEMHLKRQLAAASTKPQSFFGVAAEFESSSGWAHAVAEMQALDDWDLPSKLLGAVLAAAKSIYATLNYEKNRGKRGEQRTPIFISTDDFFPIYLYVVAQANLKNPLLVSEYLWGLCDPEQLNGEGGYYLTVLCSTLEYLKGLDMETDEGERERAQREEEALRCLDVSPTTTTSTSTSTSTTPTGTPTTLTTPTAPVGPASPQKHAEINSSTSVDSYFRSTINKKPPAAAAAMAAAAALAADEKRQRTISAPDKGASVAVAPSPSTCRLQRVVIGSSSRTAQEVVDEREKEKERLRTPLPEPRASQQKLRPADVEEEPKKEAKQQDEAVVAPPQQAEEEEEAQGKRKTVVVVAADEVEGEAGGGWGNQRARRRASKLDRRQVQQAITRFDVAQKED